MILAHADRTARGKGRPDSSALLGAVNGVPREEGLGSLMCICGISGEIFAESWRNQELPISTLDLCVCLFHI